MSLTKIQQQVLEKLEARKTYCEPFEIGASPRTLSALARRGLVDYKIVSRVQVGFETERRVVTEYRLKEDVGEI